MLEVYCVRHHGFRKTSVFVRLYVNEEPAFLKISILESVFQKIRLR